MFFICSLHAQDLNIVQNTKVPRVKKDLNLEFAISPSITYLPKLPAYESAYFGLTQNIDNNAIPVPNVPRFDTITTIYSTMLGQNSPDISSKLLYNLGLSVKYKLNNNFFIRFSPFYSVYQPKVTPFLRIDDQTSVTNRPTWDTILYFDKPNFVGLPISVGFNLNDKIDIEVGVQYLYTSSNIPRQSFVYSISNSDLLREYVTLDKFHPISGLGAINYKITPHFSFNLKCNYGVAFYIPNSIAVYDDAYYNGGGQYYQEYRLHLNRKTRASVTNFSLTTGLCYSF